MKSDTIFVCQGCDAQSPKWLGRCPECGAWNSLVEEAASPSPGRGTRKGLHRSVALEEVGEEGGTRVGTGIAEADRVLGGGLFPGGVVLVGGDPGVGKTTLLLQACGHAGKNEPVLYASGEESLAQLAARARRLGIAAKGLRLLAESSLEAVLGEARRLEAGLVVVDSIQTAAHDALTSAPGSLSQVRDCAARYIEFAKEEAVPVVLVGHITKEGMIAGPKALEHMVDAVLYLEGDRYRHLKVLRAQKNRFGTTSEMALFEMSGTGLRAVENPSAALLADRPTGVPGSVIGVALQGTRPLLFEIQTLTSPSAFGMAKRMSAGLERNRVLLLSAVLERAMRITLGDKDIFVNVVGGVALDETALDLPLCLALASAYLDKPIPGDTAAFGEVGLAGEVRGVGSPDERLAEVKALGFGRCVLPDSDARRRKVEVEGVRCHPVSTLAGAVEALLS